MANFTTYHSIGGNKLFRKSIITIVFCVLVQQFVGRHCNAAEKILFYDDFPIATINLANWPIISEGLEIDSFGIEEPSPPLSLRLNGYPTGSEAIESQTLDLSVYNSATLQYWYQRTGAGESPDTGEDLVFQYWNGSAWIEIDRQAGAGPDMTSYQQRIVTLPSAAMHSQFKFRITNSATPGNFDDWFVDDVVITISDGLVITPADGLAASGNLYGPFLPSSITYTLRNTSQTTALNFTVRNDSAWINIEPNSATLTALQNILVTVSLNAEANSLPVGLYTDTVTITNLTSSIEQTREVELTVNEPEPKLLVTVNEMLCDQILVPEELRTLNNAITLTANPGSGTVLWTLEERKGKYLYSNSYAADGPNFDWIEIAETGTNMNLTDESYYFPITLGFDFDFYGTSYRQIAVSSNGTIYFEDSLMVFDNTCLGSSVGPQSFIAMHWDDLVPEGPNNVYFEITGAEPNRVLVIEFDEVRIYNSNDIITVQAQLFENNSDVLLLYSETGLSAGSGATVGIQANSLEFMQYSCNQALLEAGLAMRFSREIGWLDAAPKAGILTAGESVYLDFTFNGNGLAELFSEQAAVLIKSNDSNSPEEIAVCILIDYDPCSIDLDGDGCINFTDFAILAKQWRLMELSWDIRADGVVNFADWAKFADGWGLTSDVNDLGEFAQQWLEIGAYCADFAPKPDSDGVVDLLDLSVFVEYWLE